MELQLFHNKAVNTSVIDVQGNGLVTTYINTFNVMDDWNEISLPGSFTKTFKENFKSIYWYLNHDPEDMIGITQKLYEDKVGAIAVGQLNMKKQASVDVWNDYLLFAENGRSLEHSIRTKAIKWYVQTDTAGNEIMYIQEQKVREWSTLTQWASNPQTEVISLKRASINNEDEIAILKKALGLNYSDEKLKAYEERINQLETLIKEAGKSTSKVEPFGVDDIVKHIKNVKF